MSRNASTASVTADVCIVGGGPAGLMAAIAAGKQRVATTVVEANATTGKKLLVTGGGRCNFTHAATIDELVRAFDRSGRFLRHAFHELPPGAVRAFMAERGIASTTEPDGCVFPATHRAVDIRDALVNEAQGLGVRFVCGNRVTQIITGDDRFRISAGRQTVLAGRVILATGGASWPQTGSTGDGYRLARELGHGVVAPKPSLVPLILRERWPRELAGVSVADVALRATVDGRKVAATGNMVFTYDGIGGPVAQDLSRFVTDAPAEGQSGIEIRLDLLPAMEQGVLAGQFQERLAGHPKKAVANVLAEFVPRRLAAALCRLAECDGELAANQVPKAARKRLVALAKSLPLHVTGTRSIAEATVTRGGVSLKQIGARTMASKVCPGLYLAGEVIDADGPCGGYNLQMCFSTGLLAGRSASHSVVNPPSSAG
jgi:predicted Rossmann fold flavoprotein